jgi:hypothetical protein
MKEIKQKTKFEKVKIKDLKPYKNNPYIHKDEDVEDLEYSIDTFGMITPIIVWKNWEIIAGHKRYYALMKGYNPENEITVVDASSLSEKEANRFRILENESRNGEIDPEKMFQEISKAFEDPDNQIENIRLNTGIHFDSLKKEVGKVFDDIQEGMTPAGEMRSHSDKTAQFILKYDMPTYEKVKKKSMEVGQEVGIASFSDLIVYLLDNYKKGSFFPVDGD